MKGRGSYARSKSLPSPSRAVRDKFQQKQKKFNLCRAVLCSSPSSAPTLLSSFFFFLFALVAVCCCPTFAAFFMFCSFISLFCFFLSFTYKALPGTHTHTRTDTATHVSRYFRVFAGCHAGFCSSLSRRSEV